MPTTTVPNPLEKTDNFDQWRIKINQGIQAILDIVNADPVNTLISIGSPINDRDMLLYDSADGVYKNTLFDTEVADYLQDNNFQPASLVKRHYFANLNNLY